MNTDNKSDPSRKCVLSQPGSCGTWSTDDDDLDGVVILLILSAAEAVCAVVCANLPVVVPQLYKEYKNIRPSRRSKYDSSMKNELLSQSRSMSRGFQKLVEGSSHRMVKIQQLLDEHTRRSFDSISLNTVVIERRAPAESSDDAHIVITREAQVIGEVERIQKVDLHRYRDCVQ